MICVRVTPLISQLLRTEGCCYDMCEGDSSHISAILRLRDVVMICVKVTPLISQLLRLRDVVMICVRVTPLISQLLRLENIFLFR